MINALLGLGAVNGALGLARGVLKTVTGAGSKSGAYSDIHRTALEQSRRPDADSIAASDTGGSRRAAATRNHQRVMRARAEELLRRLDTDRDGLLAAAELGLSSHDFHSVDLDGNGDVDIVELSKAMQAGRVPTWKA